ncbi:unnamed protein product [Cladocopium goreaui]|uniref:Uncharacterized protein R665 n=1 Tax=Cladocopium goreaui TaxID=2562237 RepID=A0A9P1G788_9DINO|nr:unnamed protein product [Cladocopium goreaui]
MSDVAMEGQLSSALQHQCQAFGADILDLLRHWGITTLRKLSWTSPERFGKLVDALPVGGPKEGDLADLRALQAELWESRKSRMAEERSTATATAPVLKVLETAAGLFQASKVTKTARDLHHEEATRTDLKAREVAKGMVGQSGRLLRDKMLQHFASVSQHAFSMMLSHLPYENLVAASEQAQEEPWYPLLTRDVLNTSLLRQDWSIRSAFMNGYIPRTNLIPLYGYAGQLRTELVAQRCLSKEELSHPRVEALQDDSRTVRMPAEEGSTSVMPCLHGFKLLFEEFTKGILKNVFDLASPTQRVFAAGGAILACLQLWKHPALHPLYRIAAMEVLANIMAFVSQGSNERREARRAAERYWLPSYSTSKKSATDRFGFVNSDIDLFICCETEEEGIDLLRRTVKTLFTNITAQRQGREDGRNQFGYSRDIRVLRSANALSVWGGFPFRTVQIMVILYKGPDEVLNFFDLDCISLGYDGKNVWGLPRSLRCLQTGYNFVEPAKLRRWSTGPRIIKYKKRGFGTVFFEICKHSPRCDLPSTLDDETARRIAALQGCTTSQQDFGYGEVELPFTGRMKWGMHLDVYMETHESGREARRARVESQSCGLWEPADNDLVAGKYVYIAGDNSASEESITQLLEVKLESHGLPSVRWKNVDLWESRRGNEFLPRCYMCRLRIDPSGTFAERPRLCACCEVLSAQKRQQVADLTGKTAVVTGGRVNIGFATALKLLRMGATVAVTTRFPKDCLRRYSQEEDAAEWLPRLSVYGSDFRSVPLVSQLGEKLALAFPRLDILINNAAQTVRRPAAHYAQLLQGEMLVLEERLESCIKQQADLKSLEGLREPIAMIGDDPSTSSTVARAPGLVEEMKDDRTETSWTAKIGDVSWVESLEVQVVNVTAPFVLLSKLKSSLLVKDEPLKVMHTFGGSLVPPDAASARPLGVQVEIGASDLLSSPDTGVFTKRRVSTLSTEVKLASARQMRFVVNVTSQEGSFRSLGNKGGNHPHTNMAKASLNMMTCSVADEFSKEGVAVVSVDTGWISKMKPDPVAETEPHVQSSPPLSTEDGAARVLDPILSTLNGNQPVTGCLLRNFQPVDW